MPETVARAETFRQATEVGRDPLALRLEHFALAGAVTELTVRQQRTDRSAARSAQITIDLVDDAGQLVELSEQILVLLRQLLIELTRGVAPRAFAVEHDVQPLDRVRPRIVTKHTAPPVRVLARRKTGDDDDQQPKP